MGCTGGGEGRGGTGKGGTALAADRAGKTAMTDGGGGGGWRPGNKAGKSGFCNDWWCGGGSWGGWLAPTACAAYG